MLTKLLVHYFRDTISGFRLDGERLVKLPTPPPLPVAMDSDKKKKKKEKHKKRKRRSSSSDSDSDADNERAAPKATNEEVLPGKESSEEKKIERKKDKEERKKKRKTSQSQENNSPPARAITPATTPTPVDNATTTNNNNTREVVATATTGVGGNEDLAWRASLKRTDIKNGAYSSAEQQTIRDGVISFAQARNLSTEDFSWIFAGKGQRSSDVLGLWKHVAIALPKRTIKSVAAAGNRLFHPDAKKGKWTPEEDEELSSLVAELANKWVQIGSRLGRTREACRVRWREIQLGNEKKKGKWSPDEELRLQNAVNEYLQAKKQAEGVINTGVPTIVSMPANVNGSDNGAGPSRGNIPGLAVPNTTTFTTPASTPASQQKIDKRIVLDDIDWGVISQRVETRSNIQCLEKWYDQLAPSMVDRGDWGTGDDRRLLKALWRAGNVAEFEVQWDGLVPERTAQQARRRWRLMVKVVPEYKEKEFSEVVEYLVSKHLPQLVVKEPRGGGQQNTG